MAWINLVKKAVGKAILKSFQDGVIDDLTFLYNRSLGSDSVEGVPNASFENDVDGDGVPDGWEWTATGGTLAHDLDLAGTKHGSAAVKITSTGSGGGYLTSAEYFAVSDGRNLTYQFALKCSGATVACRADVLYYDDDKTFVSSVTLFDSSSGNPTSWAYKTILANVPTNARFAKLRFYGANSATAGSTWFDDIRIIIGTLNKAPAITVFSSSGTFVVPDYVTRIKIRLWSGGGGGGAGSGSTGADLLSGGGGGGGGYAEAIAAVTPGETLTVTVGSGGAAGFAGSASSVTNASAATLAAHNGGAAGAVAATGTGGSGGTSGTGTFAYNGGNGSDGARSNGTANYEGMGAYGGNAALGGSGGASVAFRFAPTAGNNGRIPGGGGGGGVGAASGGAGARGEVIIEY